MTGRQGRRRALAVDIKRRLAAIDLVLLDTARVVGNIVEQRQVRTEFERRKRLADEVHQDLPVRQRTVDGGPHGAEVFLAGR